MLLYFFSADPIAQAIQISQRRPQVWGDSQRVHIDPEAHLVDALLNVNSGHITVGAHSFFGHGVMLLTGAHAYEQVGKERHPYPATGRDIVIGEGVWIASRAVILGPCRIGDNAVVAAGAVVRSDVPERTLVAGVPARPIRSL